MMKTSAKRKRRRWVFAILCLFLLWATVIQIGCLNMRTPDRKWSAKLLERGQTLAPAFLDVASGKRTIHAVSVSASDSLPLVVLVHGSPGSADAYLEYLADTALSRQTRMVALDRPGFGYTTGFGHSEPSLAAQAAAVEALVQRLSPNQKVILVGHSMGGPVIARYAMDYPEHTAALVLVASSIDPAMEEHPWWQSAVDLPPLRWFIPKSLWTSNSEIIPLEKELEQMLPRWPEVRCPVTTIHATDDQLVPFGNMDFAKRVLVNCPAFKEVHLDDGDHFILWSRKDLVRDEILKLL